LQGLNGRLRFKVYYDHVLTIIDYDYNHDYEGHKGHIEPKPLIFKIRPVLSLPPVRHGPR
jgi:hypothetical protein